MLDDWSGHAPPAIVAIVGTFAGLTVLYLLGCVYTSRR
jgi:hypothetical protein